MITKDLKGTKGITLISLVVSIVVLLILAGVSIMTLTGDNGLLTRTVGAKNKTKLAEAQEIASLEYEAGLIDSKVNTTSEAGTIENIKNVLIEKGFTVDYETTSTESITAVRLLDGTTPVTNVNLETVGDNTEKILTIDTIMGGAPGTRIYYVQIDNMWHEIEELANKKGIEIKKDGKASLDKSNVNNSNQIITIEISGLDESTTVKNVVENGESTTYEDITSQTTFENGNKIKITAGTSNLSNVTITVSVTNVTENYAVALTVTKMLAPTATTATPNTTTFSTAYGTIDVIWLDTLNNIKSEPNEPDLFDNTLEKVTWTKEGDIWVEDESPKSTWYSYNAVTTRETSGYTTDNNTSMWANVKNPVDGSYFVWIPRYAYRITYYSSETSTIPTGYYDGWGMWKAEDGQLRYALDEGIETVTYNGKKYIVHPAFETNLDNGGWDEDISGFWIAKYEMSGENYDSNEWVSNGPDNNGLGHSNNSNRRVVSKPSTVSSIVSSLRNMTISNCYTTSYEYDRMKESHLIKNSEWGAVAYLAHSSYGRNGREIDINNSSDFLTGNGGGNISGVVEVSEGITNYFNTTLGAKASTTGNIYGIYDMSGGAYEYMSAFGTNDSSGYLRYYGTAFAGEDNNYNCSKYATKYDTTISSGRGTDIYIVTKVGDALKEVNTAGIYTKYDAYFNAWQGDSATFFGSYPFVTRGGLFSSVGAGIFCSNSEHGSASYQGKHTFRIVLNK